MGDDLAMEIDELQTRREMVELAVKAALLPGAALFLSSFFAPGLRAAPAHDHMGSSAAPPDPNLLRDYRPKFFGPEDFQALQAFTEILIPTDDTPGAREAHCAHFIDFVLQASGEAAPRTQADWHKAMKVIEDAGFHKADAKRRAELVAEMARPETDREAVHPAFSAYRLVKQQTAFAFYTSRAGMIEALDYKGNSYNLVFPACNHPEHHTV